MIEIKGLGKDYKDKTALDNISVNFEMGKIYGLLGSNGAGKTTLINIISNRVFVTSGECLIDGEPAMENENAQSKVFCITEKSKYPADLKIKNLFKWESEFQSNFDIEYALELARKFELDINKRIKTLSTGYTTILKTIVTLASNAPIMILDEPVLGIDALYRETFYDNLTAHHKKNKNLIIVATHLIDEIERILDNVIIIHKGKILADCVKPKKLSEFYLATLKGGAK